MRDSTVENRKRKRPPTSDDFGITKADIFEARESGRLCSHKFSEFGKHLSSIKRKNRGSDKSKCSACGEGTYYKCMYCGVPLCYSGSRESKKDWSCMMDYHDEDCFGLLRCDSSVKKKWNKPTLRQRLRHADKIRKLLD